MQPLDLYTRFDEREGNVITTYLISEEITAYWTDFEQAMGLQSLTMGLHDLRAFLLAGATDATAADYRQRREALENWWSWVIPVAVTVYQPGQVLFRMVSHPEYFSYN